MNISTDVLNDLCRRIRNGMAVASDADFLEYVFRDQAGWIKPEQGLPAEDDVVEVIGGGDLDDTLYITRGIVAEDGVRILLSGLRDACLGWDVVRAWRPAPGIPGWLHHEEPCDAAD